MIWSSCVVRRGAAGFGDQTQDDARLHWADSVTELISEWESSTWPELEVWNCLSWRGHEWGAMRYSSPRHS